MISSSNPETHEPQTSSQPEGKVYHLHLLLCRAMTHQRLAGKWEVNASPLQGHKRRASVFFAGAKRGLSFWIPSLQLHSHIQAVDKKKKQEVRENSRPLPFQGHHPHLKTEGEVELGDGHSVLHSFSKCEPMSITLGPIRHRLPTLRGQADLDGQRSYPPSTSSQVGREDVHRCSVLTMGRGSRKEKEVPHSLPSW